MPICECGRYARQRFRPTTGSYNTKNTKNTKSVSRQCRPTNAPWAWCFGESARLSRDVRVLEADPTWDYKRFVGWVGSPRQDTLSRSSIPTLGGTSIGVRMLCNIARCTLAFVVPDSIPISKMYPLVDRLVCLCALFVCCSMLPSPRSTLRHKLSRHMFCVEYIGGGFRRGGLQFRKPPFVVCCCSPLFLPKQHIPTSIYATKR